LTVEALEGRSLPSSLAPAGAPSDAALVGALSVAGAAAQQHSFHAEGTFTVLEDLGKNQYLIGLGGTAGPDGDFSAQFVARKTGANVSGSYTLVFADGTVTFDYSVKKNEKTGIFEGDFTVLGGTGTYAGASGSGEICYPLDAVVNPFMLDGTLTY
jgi:hypothetical protein